MIEKLEYSAYAGERFQIEWYYDPQHRSPALDYYRKLPEGRRIKVLLLFKLMGDAGKIFDPTRFRNECDRI